MRTDGPEVQSYVKRLNDLRRSRWALKYYATAGRDLADLRNDDDRARYRKIEYARSVARKHIKRVIRVRAAIAKYNQRAATQRCAFPTQQAQ